VISARNLLIENSVSRNTSGVPPAAGVDLEPNHTDEGLENIIIRNCLFEDNVLGMFVFLTQLASPTKVSVVWENNIVRGGSRGIDVRRVHQNGPQCQIVFRGCTVEDSSRYGIHIRSVDADSVELSFEDCLLVNVATETATDEALSPIVIVSEITNPLDKKLAARVGGVTFGNVFVTDDKERPVVAGISLNPHALEAAVKSVEIVFDGSPVYSASALPAEGEVMIETRRLPDGRHMLEARVALHDEQRGLLTGPITEKAAFVTRHFWDLYDDFTAPIGTGWFAGFEFSKTCAASAGWEYSSGREEEFLGDGSRRVRPSNSTEHLAWETPLLSGYKLTLYAKEIAISSVIWVARISVPP
jgi:hypothetical protein